IVNCWRKTGILAPISHEEIEVATNSQDTLLEHQEQDIDVLMIDLTFQDPDPEIRNQLNTYLNLNDLHIITEEKLDNSEIIEIVLDEANQCENRDPDNSDEEQPEIPISEGLMGLNKFIGFFEQQTDANFKSEDLKIFRKYLTLVNRKYIESKLYIGRLARDARERDVEKLFRNYGTIREIKLMNGFGFVEFRDHRDADDVVYTFNGKSFMGEKIVEAYRPFTITQSKPPSPTPLPFLKKGFEGPNAKSWRNNQSSQFSVIFSFIGVSVVEFSSYEDMKNAIRKLDDTELKGKHIILREAPDNDTDRDRDRDRRRRSRSRSRSPRRSSRRSPSRSPRRSSRRSRSRSKTPPPNGKDHSSRSPSPRRGREDSRSPKRSRSRSGERERAHDDDK
ncbi:16485_t:CDS:2, partial [Racocetra fulgida]